MKTYYFTFGRVHTLQSGESLGDCYCPINAKDEQEARNKMIEARGNQWSSVYDSKDKAGVEQFHLSEVMLAMIRLNPKLMK